jgi:hypothetical protein
MNLRESIHNVAPFSPSSDTDSLFDDTWWQFDHFLIRRHCYFDKISKSILHVACFSGYCGQKRTTARCSYKSSPKELAQYKHGGLFYPTIVEAKMRLHNLAKRKLVNCHLADM